MNSFKDIWLEKVAAEIPEHKHPDYAKKEHKHDQYATKRDAKDIAEDVVEDHKEELHKDAAMNPSEVKNNPKPVLVVGYTESDEMSKTFIQRLDKVLTSMSGIDRLQIKAVNLMKERGVADQLNIGKGITLFKRGKIIGELSFKSQENDIRKFMESHRKDFI
jgi:thioredoxin-like negative regulator of GroEL